MKSKKIKPVIIWIIFLASVAAGFLNLFDNKPNFWKSWEFSSVFATLVYTLFLYIFGFIQEEFKGLPMKDIAILLVGLICLFFITVITAFPSFSLGSYSYKIERIHSLIVLTITSGLFWLLDYKISRKCENVDIKRSFHLSKVYSDRPITIIFSIMTLYCAYINFTIADPEQIKHFEPFFSGSIAFQMMISNLIRTINDDPIIEENKISN